MALKPINKAHALQIQAGTLGRKAGHDFEDMITSSINEGSYPISFRENIAQHVNTADPAILLLHYIASFYGLPTIKSAAAISTGALATSEDGKKWLLINGAKVNRCKSDLVITIVSPDDVVRTVGVSTKQCNTATPTNAQLYFTTARGFTKLLRDNEITITDEALKGLRQFCGDEGFRPSDNDFLLKGRKVDPRRFFWEEIIPAARREWESILSEEQDKITRLLLQKAYMDDPFVPDFVIHKTKSAPSWGRTEVAIYSIDELVSLSRQYQGFSTKAYSVRKGSYKDPKGQTHLAPRFGIIQMQRGGQAQHPEQLQFNLEAGYFYKIGNAREQKKNS
ncbi:MAG: hypothetical protein EPN97_13520 [Alphaproteobacteria bacterium]|nr:MAG: hypothetical protein EPN97_13520 [Alphaproteobacteria bacterium]